MPGGSLWLEKKYLIHVDDIHRLTRVSTGGNPISTCVPRRNKATEEIKRQVLLREIQDQARGQMRKD